MKSAKEVSQIPVKTHPSVLKKIEKEIISAQKNGLSSLWWYSDLPIGDRTELIDAGYSVDDHWEKNEVLINIKWK